MKRTQPLKINLSYMKMNSVTNEHNEEISMISSLRPIRVDGLTTKTVLPNSLGFSSQEPNHKSSLNFVIEKYNMHNERGCPSFSFYSLVDSFLTFLPF
jgi:hypothetical protein